MLWQSLALRQVSSRAESKPQLKILEVKRNIPIIYPNSAISQVEDRQPLIRVIPSPPSDDKSEWPPTCNLNSRRASAIKTILRAGKRSNEAARPRGEKLANCASVRQVEVEIRQAVEDDRKG